MSQFVWLNGRCVPRENATLSVYDGGWLHGAGLFETMRAENGRVFRLRRHLDRLRASADRILASIEPGQLPAAGDFEELLERNGLEDARMRLTVTAGDVLEGADPAADRFSIALTAAPLTPYPEALFQSGVAVLISPYRQSPTDPLAGHKTVCYLPRLLSLKVANAAQCLEALWFTTDNLLAEGAISNVFVIKNGRIQTPPLDTPILPGIARACVIELCSESDIELSEEPVTIYDLLDADEVFLTNTMMQVMPVRTVEKSTIKDGRPGPMTAQLRRLYLACARRECYSDG